MLIVQKWSPLISLYGSFGGKAASRKDPCRDELHDQLHDASQIMQKNNTKKMSRRMGKKVSAGFYFFKPVL